jgi:GNAT superfamily N-acetyltransferase
MRLREFAPSPERDDSDEIPNQLLVLANRWWNATDKQPQIEHVLNSMGWSIHQVESEDDAVQLQHRDGTTYFISADDFDPDLFEISDERLQDYLHRAGKQVDSRMERMARARERLNKGYEIYHADRPAGSTQIVDRFEADTPALAQQYYERFIHDYESDVDFDLRLRRSTGIVEDAEPKVQQAQRDGLDLTAHRYGNELTIDAGTHGRNLARVVFDVAGQTLVARDLLVDERYRGQGIAASMYNWAKELGYRVQRSTDQTDAGRAFWDKNRGSKRVWETELDEIAPIPQGDFGDEDTLTPPKYDVEKTELPGGSGFTYAVGKPAPGDLEIMIFDGDTLAAELDLFDTQDVTNAWRVNTVAVNPQYRGRGLGKALYGIALSILGLTLEAGDTQTKHGRRMWLMLNSIPGVEVMGYNMEFNNKYRPRPGDKIIDQNERWTKYTFPVKPGVNSMRSGRHGTGMYTSQASMIAKWTGR